MKEIPAEEYRCKATNSLGERCKAYKLKDSDYCSMHDPNHAHRFDVYRRERTKALKEPVVIKEIVPQITNGKQLITFINAIIEQVHTDKIKTSTAASLNSLCNTLIKAFQAFGEDSTSGLPEDIEKLTTGEIKKLLKGSINGLNKVSKVSS